ADEGCGMSMPLEEEKRALLARMQASRELYRSRFPPRTQPEQSHDPAASPLHSEQLFPRSHTFRFVQRIIHRIGGWQP
ncbi:MAG: hypothetical protein J0I60_00150, partial [Nitrosospira sp.]|nr:hypothetical protein [Nitrosospira sp.]